MRLHTGIGMSEAADAAEAGLSAAAEAMAQLRGEKPALVIVYASIGYDLPRLLAAIRQVTQPAELIGATTAGHFARGTTQVPGPGGVAVLAMTAGEYRFGVTSAAHICADLD